MMRVKETCIKAVKIERSKRNNIETEKIQAQQGL